MAINERGINEVAINAGDETIAPLVDATDFAVVPPRIFSAVVRPHVPPAKVPSRSRAAMVQSYNRTVVVQHASG